MGISSSGFPIVPLLALASSKKKKEKSKGFLVVKENSALKLWRLDYSKKFNKKEDAIKFKNKLLKSNPKLNLRVEEGDYGSW